VSNASRSYLYLIIQQARKQFILNRQLWDRRETKLPKGAVFVSEVVFSEREMPHIIQQSNLTKKLLSISA
jgi:hypothetical protein